MMLTTLRTIIGLMLSINLAKSQGDLNTMYIDVTGVPNILSETFGSCPIPRNCRTECTGNEDYSKPIEVDCAKKGFGPYIPDFGFYRIHLPLQWSFNFSRNGIVYVLRGDFYTPENQVPINLTSLDLSHNSIRSIHNDSFIGNVSKHMTTLLLQNNRLENLELEVFRDMMKLETLDLSHNFFVSIDTLCLSQIASLESLNLAHNRINYVQDGCFDAFVSLDSCSSTSLNLQFNRMYSYNPCAWKNAPCVAGSSSDAVNYNPTICGCGSPCIDLPNTIGGNSTWRTTAAAGEECICEGLQLNFVLNQNYPMDQATREWQGRNSDKFIVEASWEMVSTTLPFSTSLYALTEDKQSPWNTTSLSLQNQNDTMSNSSVLELERKYSWVYCVAPSNIISETKCIDLRPPSIWEYRTSAASCLSSFLSPIIIPFIAFLNSKLN